MIQKAIEYYEKGNVKSAKQICNEILEFDPDNFDALHLLGVIYHELNEFLPAVSYLQKALQISPNNALAHYNLGLAFQKLGQVNEAMAYYQKSIELDPHFARSYCNIGVILQATGQPDTAIIYLQKALQIDPSFADTFYNLGFILQNRGQLNEAIDLYQRALQINPVLIDAYNNLGNIFQDKGQLNEAALQYQKALQIDPTFTDAYYNLGTVLQSLGQIDDAISCYQKTLYTNPHHPEASNNLGFCLQEKGQYDEAAIYFQRAISLNPQYADAHYNLALYYQEQNAIDKAITYYKAAIQHKVDFVDARWNMACALLLSGDFTQGFKEYEWRWKLKDGIVKPLFHQPLWDGSDLRSKTILLFAEQGFGDTIQFARYIPMVTSRAARIILRCPKELVTLLGNAQGVHQTLSDEQALPDFDVQCPLLSLPLVFQTTLETIPSTVPYIWLDSIVKRRWEAKVERGNKRLKIGLVWTGRAKTKRERYRSLTLDMLAPLAGVDNVIFYSLQKGGAVQQALCPPHGMKLVDYAQELHDFAETAALIENLDLVISVDTAVAHLAGALGKPVWTLLPYAPDWRWLLKRTDSPWYPTMRLFRQPSPGNWSDVINTVTYELQMLVLFHTVNK